MGSRAATHGDLPRAEAAAKAATMAMKHNLEYQLDAVQAKVEARFPIEIKLKLKNTLVLSYKFPIDYLRVLRYGTQYDICPNRNVTSDLDYL